MLRARLQLNERHPVIVRIRCRRSGYVHVRVAPGETGGRYADDGIEDVVKLDCLPNHIPISTELLLPEKVTQHRDRRDFAAKSIGRCELASQRRRHSHVGEEIGRVLALPDGDRELATCKGFLPLIFEEDIVYGRGSQEFLILQAVDEEQRSPVALVAQLHVDHALWVSIGIRIKQDSVHYAEDASRGPNS